MSQQLTYYTEVLGIVGDILRVRAKDVGFGDLAVEAAGVASGLRAEAHDVGVPGVSILS